MNSTSSLEAVTGRAERRAAERVLERDRGRVFYSTRPPTDRMLYLCGPMSAYPKLNAPAFAEAAGKLRAAGFYVVSPAEPPLLQQPQTDWNAAVRRSLGAMLECDAVATVTPSGIRQSRGAMLELHLASNLEMPVLYWHAWILAADAWTPPTEETA